ncbi:MAG TPA: hypothetical protein VFK10_09150 [Burkholderiaceae bacterium]|nr:hypothetical protein [Burkholderiaceae bacterium]
MKSRRRSLLALAALSRAQPGAAPTRLRVGTTPGGSTDSIACEPAREMGRLLGRNVIQRSGATPES